MMKRDQSNRHSKFDKSLRVALALFMALMCMASGLQRPVTASGSPGGPDFPIPDSGVLQTQTINIAGVVGPIVTMSVRFTGLTSARPDDLDMILIAPDGTHNLEFWSDAGGNSAVGPVTVTISDTGATVLPDAGPIVTNTTYKPGDYSAVEIGSDFGMASLTVNHAQTNGAATFLSSFGATSGLPSPNGTWTLIARDDTTSGDAGTTVTNWALTINGATAASGTVGGKILDNDGNPVSGAVVNLSGTQSRKAITDASGSYRFDNVETTGFYTVTPERANYAFSPASRSFSSLADSTDASFTGEQTAETRNPLDTSEYFVRQQYLDFLDRNPDEGGFNYWSNQIAQCGTDALCLSNRRTDVSAAFFMEQEFQQTGSFVYGLYKGSLGRNPRFAEFMPDRSRITTAGNVLEQSKQALAENWVTRSEFKSAYPDSMSNAGFVNKLFDTAGLSNPAERQGYIDALNNGGTRSAVVLGVVESDAFRMKEYNQAFVLTQYFSYLRRDPDDAGLAFWVNVLNNREPGNFRGMVCSFVTSAEYQKRFSSVVSHSNAECGQ